MNWKAFNARFNRRKGIVAGLLLLLACQMAGGIDAAVDVLGRGYVAKSNEAYLDEARDRALETFLMLSALKAGLSVLQSSQVGISVIVDMKVQVGKVVESLVDTVDAGWKISLLSLSALYGTKILLRMGAALSGPLLYLLLIALLLYFLAPLDWRRLRKSSWSVSGGLLLLTVAAQVLLPLSVFLGSIVSHRITAPLADEAKTQIQVIHQQLAGEDPGPDDVKTHVQRVLNRFKEISQRISEKLSLLGRHVAQRIAVTVFDVFVFPVLFLLPSYWIVKAAMRHLFEAPAEPISALERPATGSAGPCSPA